MCGRYYRRGQKQELAERMRAGVIDPGIPDLIEHYIGYHLTLIELLHLILSVTTCC